MTTRIGKSATIGAVAVTAAVALLAYLAVVSSASAQTVSTTSTTSTSQSTGQTGGSQNCTLRGAGGWQGGGISLWGGGPPGQEGGQGGRPGQRLSNVNLTAGQTITITSSSGSYITVGTSSANGTASGTITFKVTGKLSQGYTLSISSGSLTVAGTTYTMSSGSAQMDPWGTSISGQGTTSQGGSFIVQASAHGTFVGSTASASLDFTNGTTEFLVTLTGSV
jgi:hypothetical protein